MKFRIKEIRNARRYSIASLAEKVGISKSYLSEIENHKKTPNGNRIEQIAKALGVNAIELIDGSQTSNDLIAHVSLLSDLSEEDRQAIFNHAKALWRQSN